MEAETAGTNTDLTWHRVHPLTPLLDTGLAAIALLGALFSVLIQNLQNVGEKIVFQGGSARSEMEFLRDNLTWILLGVGGFVLIVVLAGLLSWMSWRARAYAVDSDAVYFRSGILSKQLRKARLDRVQSIDINQKLIPRILGMAALTFEVAGGEKSSVVIKYLRRSASEELRAVMLERVRLAKADDETGRSQVSAVSQDTGPEVPAGTGEPAPPVTEQRQAGQTSAPEDAHTRLVRSQRTGAPLGSRIIARLDAEANALASDLTDTVNSTLAPYRAKSTVSADGRILSAPAHRVILAGLLSSETVVLVGVALVLVVLSIVFMFRIGPGASIGMLAGLTGVLGGLFSAVKKTLKEANFSVALTEDGLMITSGLLETTRRLIPLDRIQAVEVKQNLLWRKPGWWAVSFNIAGKGEKDSSTLFPVGTLDDIMVLLGLVLPDPGVSGEINGGDLIREAMLKRRDGAPVGPAAGLYTGQPASSKWVDLISYRVNCYALTATMLVVRRGVLTRSVTLVPHARVQSMRLGTGPVQTALGLRTLGVHSTSGPVRPAIRHMDATGARDLMFDYLERTRLARHELDRA